MSVRARPLRGGAPRPNRGRGGALSGRRIIPVPRGPARARRRGPARQERPVGGRRKLVFDTSVTPRWLETSDRFWSAYQTRDGRRFYLVDPVKKAKAPLFDHAKMAAALTTITRIPYDAQHLPFSRCGSSRTTRRSSSTCRCRRRRHQRDQAEARSRPTSRPGGRTGRAGRRDDMAGEQQQGSAVSAAGGRRGPAPPRNRTLYFEYDMATGKVTLIEDRAPSRARRAGHDVARRARPSSSRATTTST